MLEEFGDKSFVWPNLAGYISRKSNKQNDLQLGNRGGVPPGKRGAVDAASGRQRTRQGQSASVPSSPSTAPPAPVKAPSPPTSPAASASSISRPEPCTAPSPLKPSTATSPSTKKLPSSNWPKAPEFGLEPQLEGNRVLLDGRDVSRRIREQDVTAAASRVSVHPHLRAWMVVQQRALGASGGVVMEGRDIGTAVFPDAEVKIFLDAAPEVRGNRRYRQVTPGDDRSATSPFVHETLSRATESRRSRHPPRLEGTRPARPQPRRVPAQASRRRRYPGFHRHDSGRGSGQSRRDRSLPHNPNDLSRILSTNCTKSSACERFQTFMWKNLPTVLTFGHRLKQIGFLQ